MVFPLKPGILLRSWWSQLGIPTGMSTPLMLWTMPLEQKMSWRESAANLGIPTTPASQEKDTEHPMDLLGQWSTNMFMYVFILWRNIHGDNWRLLHILLIWRGFLYNPPEPKPRSKQQFCAVFLCRLHYPIVFHFIKLQSYLFFFKGWTIFHLFLHD